MSLAKLRVSAKPVHPSNCAISLHFRSNLIHMCSRGRFWGGWWGASCSGKSHWCKRAICHLSGPHYPVKYASMHEIQKTEPSSVHSFVQQTWLAECHPLNYGPPGKNLSVSQISCLMLCKEVLENGLSVAQWLSKWVYYYFFMRLKLWL